MKNAIKRMLSAIWYAICFVVLFVVWFPHVLRDLYGGGWGPDYEKGAALCASVGIAGTVMAIIGAFMYYSPNAEQAYIPVMIGICTYFIGGAVYLLIHINMGRDTGQKYHLEW